jgi:AcrR family transcriptional regulator
MPAKSITAHVPRTYRSELRRQQAEATRTRVLATAAELFATEGYAATTLGKIAAAAGVSAETVQAHGPKAALLIAAIEYAALGVSGEENLLNLDIARQLLGIEDFDESLDFYVAAQTEVHERTARLAPALFGGASIDAELDNYLTRLIASTTLQFRRLLEAHRERGWVREDVAFDEIVETGAVICSVETFLRITRRDEWTVESYRKWLRRMLVENVFISRPVNSGA